MKTIIELAREAGNGDEDWLVLTRQLFKHFPKEMERFAALVAEATSDIKYEKGYEDGYAAALRSMK